MSLNSRLLELLSTPAARAASEDDTRRAVARLLACDGSLGLSPETSADLLGQRLAEALGEAMDLRVVDATGIEPVRVSAIAAVLTAALSRSTTCQHCGDFEAGVWRRWAEIELGEDNAVRTAPGQQLRRALTQKIEDQAHALDVFAELAAAGDADGIRMHHEHLKGVSRG
jgi:hypothetical protein